MPNNNPDLRPQLTRELPSRPIMAGAIALLCLVWGTTWSVIQIGLKGIPPFTGVALRFAIAGGLLLALALARGIRLGQSRRERWLWLLNGLLSFTGSYGVVYWVEQWVPSGLTAVLFATYPLFVAALSHTALPSESVTRSELFGFLIGFGGVGLIFSEDLAALGGPGVVTGAAVMLISPLVAAMASVAIKKWGSGIHPLSLSAVPMLISAGVMGAAAVGFERGRDVAFTRTSVAALLYLAIAGSAVTFTLYYWLLSYLPVKRLALITYVVPVVAVALGVALGEPFTLRILAGAACVIAGVALAMRPARR
jgi:drug/metabolite transporter (DMT)-like permease